MSKTPIISHLYNDGTWHIQTNEQHCLGVAQLAEKFASEFGMGEWGKLLGLLHDRGKESEGFQAYIKRNSGYDPEARSNLPHHHSYVGAKLIHKIPFDQLYWLSNAIAGHHRGLYNIDELESELDKDIPEGVSSAIPNHNLSLPKFKIKQADASHVARLLFSCLVDADWLDTEQFMQPEKSVLRGKYATLEQLREKLQNYRTHLSKLPSTPLNQLRNEIQRRCEASARMQPGFFELTVPTGGGKTIASVIWAINHAIAHHKRRIIIAIPFTSIIVQTAEILRNIFGEENVVEHHSVVNDSVVDSRSLLACENWDAPIIVTTNVQLFESMFSNKPSACRKLHSIVNSVIVLDEVQSLPLSFLQPIVDGIKSYVKIFGTSFLFCTASQPILDGNRNGCNGAVFEGIDRDVIRDIIGTDLELHDRLRRVELSYAPDSLSFESVAQELLSHRRVLCIVNSRSNALKLYQELTNVQDDAIPTFHLSRQMCSAHILQTINKIKSILANPSKGVRVISTQLIEAGVDIDFPIVYREFAGLDSVLQAAGRCNREGNLEKGKTIVFSFMKNYQKGYLRLGADAMKDLRGLYPEADWFSPEIMRKYYERLYSKSPYFDCENINRLLGNPKNCQFEEASKKFNMITESGTKIIINFGDANELIEKLKYTGPTLGLSRKLGRYSVNVPERIFKEFQKGGLIEEPYPGYYYIQLLSQYDRSTGLKLDNDYLDQLLIISDII